MRLLAIDSSGVTATVALMTDGALTAEYTTNDKKTHSQTLLPMIAAMLEAVGAAPAELDAIAVSKGPGSFTGLRIGAATAKGLGQAIGCPLISVPALDAMALQAYGYPGIIVPMMDARRNQVYTGLYSFEQNKMQVVQEQCACGIEEILIKINEIGKEVVFLGDGVPVQTETIEQMVTVPHYYALPHQNRQRAASVGALAIEYFKEGKIQTAKEHVPDYLRLSQAERERKEAGLEY